MAIRARSMILVFLAALLVPLLPTADAGAATPKTGQLLTAAGQVSQWIECTGPSAPAASGAPSTSAKTSPTVVLVPGLGASHTYWTSVRDGLLPTTRVCWYDRPGLGYSARRQGPTKVSAVTHATELDALLTAAGETGPVVIVGHSYGGLLTRAFAQNFPSRTAGVVLVDSSYSTQWRGYGKFWGEAGSLINMKKTEKAVFGLPKLRKKPLIVLGAGMYNSATWQQNQVIAAALSRNSVHVTARWQSHVIMAANPRIVVEAIREVEVAATVLGTALTPCATNLATIWAPLGGICGPRK